MVKRITFNHIQKTAKSGGWAEGFFNNTEDRGATVTLAADLRSNLLAMKGFETQIDYLKVLDVGFARKGSIIRYPGVTNAFTGAQIHSDYPTTVLLIVYEDTSGNKIRQPMHGIWDSVVDEGGFYRPDLAPDWVKAFKAFQKRIKDSANGWCIRTLKPDTVHAKKAITNLTPAGVVTCPAHGFSVDQRVRISEVEGYLPKFKVNDVWRVASVPDVNTFTLYKFVLRVITGAYVAGGFARRQEYNYYQVKECDVAYASERKVGRPKEVLIGRRKTRR